MGENETLKKLVKEQDLLIAHLKKGTVIRDKMIEALNDKIKILEEHNKKVAKIIKNNV